MAWFPPPYFIRDLILGSLVIYWLTPIAAVDAGTYWGKAKKWDNRRGRMTISGDASHPITPRRFAAIP